MCSPLREKCVLLQKNVFSSTCSPLRVSESKFISKKFIAIYIHTLKHAMHSHTAMHVYTHMYPYQMSDSNLHLNSSTCVRKFKWCKYTYLHSNTQCIFTQRSSLTVCAHHFKHIHTVQINLCIFKMSSSRLDVESSTCIAKWIHEKYIYVHSNTRCILTQQYMSSIYIYTHQNESKLHVSCIVL